MRYCTEMIILAFFNFTFSLEENLLLANKSHIRKKIHNNGEWMGFTKGESEIDWKKLAR